LVVVPRGEHQDRCIAPGPQFATDVGAVHVGEPEVEHDERRPLCGRHRERLTPGRGFAHGPVERFQHMCHRAPDLALVVNDEKVRGGGHGGAKGRDPSSVVGARGRAQRMARKGGFFHGSGTASV